MYSSSNVICAVSIVENHWRLLSEDIVTYRVLFTWICVIDLVSLPLNLSCSRQPYTRRRYILKRL